MRARTRSRSRTGLDRALAWMTGALVLGLLGFAVFYVLDQRVDTGPSTQEAQVTAAEQAVVAAPSDLGLRLRLAAAYSAAGRVEDSVSQYDEVLRAKPDLRAALLGKGQVLFRRGDLDAAITPLQQVATTSEGGEFSGQDADLQAALYFLGAIASQQGRTGDAISYLSQALRIEPTDSDALYLLGTALVADGQARNGIAALERAVSFVPTGWCEPYLSLAQAYTGLGKKAAAHYAHAMSRFCQGAPDEAQAELEPLVRGRQRVKAMVGLGLIAEAESRRADAVRWYRKALARDPRNAAASSGLARLGAGHGATGSTTGSTTKDDVTAAGSPAEGSK